MRQQTQDGRTAAVHEGLRGGQHHGLLRDGTDAVTAVEPMVSQRDPIVATDAVDDQEPDVMPGLPVLFTGVSQPHDHETRPTGLAPSDPPMVKKAHGLTAAGQGAYAGNGFTGIAENAADGKR